MDPLFEPNRKKKGSKYQLKFYKEPQAKKRPRTEKDHRYVKFTSTQFGGVSVAQSSIQTTVISGSEDNVTAGVTAGPVEDDDNAWIDVQDNEPPLEQAYLDHISEGAIDERLKRERPKGVSPKVRAILIS
jgi:hypothetical protein